MSQRPSTPPARVHPLSSRPPPPALGRDQLEALTVAMVVAPGVYARNRMFDLFSSPAARRARMRAGLVRGIVPQLARATAISLAESGGSFVLRYQIPLLRLSRVVELSAPELAALRFAAERAHVRVLPFGAGDKELVVKVLARLLGGDAALALE